MTSDSIPTSASNQESQKKGVREKFFNGETLYIPVNAVTVLAGFLALSVGYNIYLCYHTKLMN